MKVICLMPVKNEADLLPITLGIISQYCDVIIIADQMSTDGSREIYKNYPKVTVIDNTREGHSNQVRWDLLIEARKHGSGNLIICLDADEYIPPALFDQFLRENKFNVGDSFRFPWIQLWKSTKKYNNTGVWYRNYQRAAWVDDGITNYEAEIIINDHTSRIPTDFLHKCKRITNTPIIHLQWVSWEKTQFKQALYRCTELVKNPENFISINSAYSISLDKKRIKLSETPDIWIKDLKNIDKIKKFLSTWHPQEILRLFDKYGILFFEPLQIWHIPELEQEFTNRVGRKPISITENRLLTFYKNLKRRLIKVIHY